jgi:hypothetical protein
MPFKILNLIEKDETLATCQCFNAEVCYGSGLQYNCSETTAAYVRDEVENFIRDNADSFPEWHNSDTAKLFSPPIFRNKKESPGYFF